MSNFRIVHNGYKIEYANSMEEVEKYMTSVLDKYRHLHPTKIFDRTINKKVRIVRFRYETMYEEDFIIDIK